MMESLIIDFTAQHGHEMVVFRDPPFLRGEMDEVDLNMLQAERAQRLLPISWVEMDGNMSFRYGIAGRRLLSHKLIGGGFGMDEYMQVLVGLVEALEECGHYLLRESCCLIQERFLFVGDDGWSDIRVAYLPLRESAAVRPVREELLAVAVRLIGKVSQVDGEGLQDVLRLLGGSDASPWLQIRTGLLAALERLRERRREQKPQPGDAAGQSGYWSDGARLGWQTGDLPVNGGSGLVDRQDDAGTRFPREETSQFRDQVWPAPDNRSRDNSRARWVASAGALLSIAAVWRFVYLPAPDPTRLLASIGLTLLAAWGLSVLWRKLETSEDVQPAAELNTGDLPEALPYGQAEEGWAARLWNSKRKGGDEGMVDSGTITGYGEAELLPGAGMTPDENMMPDKEAAPSGLTMPDETVLLSEVGDSGGEDGYFIREYGGQSIRIPLHAGISVIGRSADLVQIVDGAEGVSRTHLEVEVGSDGVRVRDLASRNGTLLEGEPMIPYKEYDLRHGGALRLAGAEGPRYTLYRH